MHSVRPNSHLEACYLKSDGIEENKSMCHLFTCSGATKATVRVPFEVVPASAVRLFLSACGGRVVSTV